MNHPSYGFLYKAHSFEATTRSRSAHSPPPPRKFLSAPKSRSSPLGPRCGAGTNAPPGGWPGRCDRSDSPRAGAPRRSHGRTFHEAGGSYDLARIWGTYIYIYVYIYIYEQRLLFVTWHDGRVFLTRFPTPRSVAAPYLVFQHRARFIWLNFL